MVSVQCQKISACGNLVKCAAVAFTVDKKIKRNGKSSLGHIFLAIRNIYRKL
jgi:hypothetical protein